LSVGFYAPTRSTKDLVKFVLNNQESTDDEFHTKHLDVKTILARKIYTSVLLDRCPQLKTLDGLTVNRDEKGDDEAMWTRLASLKIYKTNTNSSLT